MDLVCPKGKRLVSCGISVPSSYGRYFGGGYLVVLKPLKINKLNDRCEYTVGVSRDLRGGVERNSMEKIFFTDSLY